MLWLISLYSLFAKPDIMDLLQMEHWTPPNFSRVWKRCLSAYKTCNISETAEDRAKVTVKPTCNCLYKIIHKSAIGTKMYDLEWRISKIKGFYRAMHFSAYARSWDRTSSVCLSVCLSVTLVICDHIGWKSWKITARTISHTPSLFVAKRRSTYSKGNMGKFWGD